MGVSVSLQYQPHTHTHTHIKCHLICTAWWNPRIVIFSVTSLRVHYSCRSDVTVCVDTAFCAVNVLYFTVLSLAQLVWNIHIKEGPTDCVHICKFECCILFCVMCGILQYCIVLYCTVLYFTVLSCTVLYCTVLHCVELCCTVLYCTVL